MFHPSGIIKNGREISSKVTCLKMFLLFLTFIIISDTSLSFGESQAKKCKLECKRLVPDSMPKTKTLFLTGNWRQQLCKCDECLKLYQQENIAFLTDEEDTVHHYESQAKNEGEYILNQTFTMILQRALTKVLDYSCIKSHSH